MICHIPAFYAHLVPNFPVNHHFSSRFTCRNADCLSAILFVYVLVPVNDCWPAINNGKYFTDFAKNYQDRYKIESFLPHCNLTVIPFLLFNGWRGVTGQPLLPRTHLYGQNRIIRSHCKSDLEPSWRIYNNAISNGHALNWL